MIVSKLTSSIKNDIYLILLSVSKWFWTSVLILSYFLWDSAFFSHKIFKINSRYSKLCNCKLRTKYSGYRIRVISFYETTTTIISITYKHFSFFNNTSFHCLSKNWTYWMKTNLFWVFLVPLQRMSNFGNSFSMFFLLQYNYSVFAKKLIAVHIMKIIKTM